MYSLKPTNMHTNVCAKLLQSCLTLGDPMDCSPSGSSVHGMLQALNAGVGCHALLQGIFPTQGSNLCLIHLHWHLPDPRIKPASHTSALAGGFFTTGTTWEAPCGSYKD